MGIAVALLAQACLLARVGPAGAVAAPGAPSDASTGAGDWAVRVGDEDLRERALRHAPALDRDARLIEGDFVVEEDETITEDLIVAGDLTVRGKVKGDVLAFGDIRLGPDALVRGDVVSVGGEIERADGSEVRGDVVEVQKEGGGHRVRVTAGTEGGRETLEGRPLFPRSSRGQVLFRYENAEVEAVSLVGDFNGWDPEADPMERTGDVWECSVHLDRGRYEYAFLVDGEWVTDPSNPDVVKDAETDQSYSVVRVDRRGRVQEPTRTRCELAFERALDNVGGTLRYNRVDGLYLAGNLRVRRPHTYQPSLYGELGYAFRREVALGELEVCQPILGTDSGLAAGFRYYRNTYAHDFDTEIISDMENTLAALFLKEDFRDYYERQGGALFATLRGGSHVQLRAEYRNDDLRSLPKATDWAFFGKDKCFPCNPSLESDIPFCGVDRRPWCYSGDDCRIEGHEIGDLKSVEALVAFDFRDSSKYGTRGLYARAGAETAGGELGGDYEFTKCWVDIRKYTRLAPKWFLDLRVMAGDAGDDPLPVFKEYYVGGIGTLPARGYKEFRGDRMMLGSVEYRVALFSDLHTVIFLDSGDAWYEGERGYDLKTDVGVGLQDADNDFRVSYAKRSEDLSAEGVWMLRLNRTF